MRNPDQGEGASAPPAALKSVVDRDSSARKDGPVSVEDSGAQATLDKLIERVHSLEARNEELEAALYSAHERFRRMKANIPGLVYVLELRPDGSTSLPYISENCREMFGLEPDAVVKDASVIMSLQVPEDAARMEKATRESAQTLRPFRHEGRRIVDGEVRWYDCFSRPEKLPDGRIVWDGIILDITEQRQAQNALLLTQACFDKAAIGIHRVGKDLRIEEVNDCFCRSLGYSREELLQMKISDIDEVVDDTWLSEQGKALRENGVVTFETTHRRKDGTRFPVQVTVSRIVHEGKRFTYSFSLDITERKQAEEALLASEAKYRQLHETMIDAFACVDMEGTIVDANKAFCELVGYTEEELRRLSYVDITPEMWREREAEILQTQTIKLGHSEVYEKEYRRKDGMIVPVELRVFLTRDAAGLPSGMWAIVRDISERKRVEQALRLTQFCFEKAAIGICRVERDRNFIEVNEEFCRMVGYSREDLLKMQISDVCEEVTAEWMEAHRNALSKTGVRRFEVTFKRRDGERFPMAVTTCRIVYEGKEYVYSFNVDISERKRIERDLMLKRDAMENSLNGFAILDEQLRFIYANAAYLRMWGYDSQDELLGKSPASHCVDPEFPNRVGLEIHRQGECTLEFVAKRKDGSTFDALIAARHSLDVEGAPVYVVSLLDISERKRAEEALRQSEERLLLALAAANQAFYDLNVKTGLAEVSPEYAIALGYSPDDFEIDMQKLVSWLHPEDKERTVEVYRECVRGAMTE
ncbi:MAG: PAS domain S-box protein, partial [Candidatus Hydrogenedentales bacterium]